MTEIVNAQLLAVVRIAEEERVRCQNPGCGHGVHAAVHIVRESGALMVLGSTCFVRRYGSSKALGNPRYNLGAGGRSLTPEERELLAFNTELLLARFGEEERLRIQREQILAEERRRLLIEEEARRADASRLARERESAGFWAPQEKLRLLREEFGRRRAVQHQIEHLSILPAMPSEVKLVGPPVWATQVISNGSFFCYVFKDGSHWILYKLQSGEYALRPWPSAVEGWDEALPPSIGRAQADLGCYLISDYVSFIMAVRPYIAGVRNTSNPVEIQHQFDLLGGASGLDG